MLLKINPRNPEKKKMNKVVDCLKSGGIIVYPTDTIYAFGCDVGNKEAIKQICGIKNIHPDKAHLSFVFYDFTQITDYTKNLDTATFKYMKNTLPGPYTFILKANKQVPKLFDFNKKTIGIRIPGNAITRTLVKDFGKPVISSSIHDDDRIITYMTDPGKIYNRFKSDVDIVIDGGIGSVHDSTILDFSGLIPVMVREGKGG